MAVELTLARPYAKAIFRIAKGVNDFDSWSALLDVLSVILNNTNVQNIIKNPLIANKEKEIFINSLVDTKLLDEKAQNFISLLSKNNRLNVIDGIKELFESYKYAALNMIKLTLTSAVKLNAAQQKEYIAALSEYFGGKKIEAQFKSDKSLLGGVVVNAGDAVIDFSLKGKLARMGEALAS